MNTLETMVAQRPATSVAEVLERLTDIDQLPAETVGNGGGGGVMATMGPPDKLSQELFVALLH